MERLPRKLKKKIRVCALCLTGNPNTKKERISRKSWINLKNDFEHWLKTFSIDEIKTANSVHLKEYSFSERKRLKTERNRLKTK
jgi:hypothetical protein